MEILPARSGELPLLHAVEVASGGPFREFGLREIADDDPMPLHELEHAHAWAPARGLTLTTFRDIPWNAPYSARLGFREVTGLTPGLAEVVAAEAARGLDPATRVCMRRAV